MALFVCPLLNSVVYCLVHCLVVFSSASSSPSSSPFSSFIEASGLRFRVYRSESVKGRSAFFVAPSPFPSSAISSSPVISFIEVSRLRFRFRFGAYWLECVNGRPVLFVVCSSSSSPSRRGSVQSTRKDRQGTHNIVALTIGAR